MAKEANTSHATQYSVEVRSGRHVKKKNLDEKPNVTAVQMSMHVFQTKL